MISQLLQALVGAKLTNVTLKLVLNFAPSTDIRFLFNRLCVNFLLDNVNDWK